MPPLKTRDVFPPDKGWVVIENDTDTTITVIMEMWGSGFYVSPKEKVYVHTTPDYGYPTHFQFWKSKEEPENGVSIFCADAIYDQNGVEKLDMMDDEDSAKKER
jgi:hypothetical protein